MDFLFPFDIHKSQADELFAYIGYRPVKALEKSTYDTKERQKGERKSEWEKESAMEKGGTKRARWRKEERAIKENGI